MRFVRLCFGPPFSWSRCRDGNNHNARCLRTHGLRVGSMSCLLFLVLASVLLLFASCPAFVVLMSSQSTRGEIALVRILDLNFDFGVGFIRKKRCEKPGVRAGLARWRWRISRRLWTPRTYPVVSACFMHQNTRKGSFPRMKSDEDDEESFQEIPGRFQGPRHAESSKRVRAKAPE